MPSADSTPAAPAAQAANKARPDKPAGPTLVRVASFAELEAEGVLTVAAGSHTLALFLHEGAVRAVDNRCPHMGFPLDRGTVADGILICHWHHARFCLRSGGTFDPWADDVRAFPAVVRDGAIYVDITPPRDPMAAHRRRLRQGLERNISLVLAKSAIHLLEGGEAPVAPFETGVRFGVAQRRGGWASGLTILTCMMNLSPSLDPVDRTRAFTHGLSAVAADCAGVAPRHPLDPLPSAPDVATCKDWLRLFVEGRDSDGAERCIATAVDAGATPRELADMLFAAVTDHRYLSNGHVLDFTNKALEALDQLGWCNSGPVLASLIPAYAAADRAEEERSWQSPVNLPALLADAFAALPEVCATGCTANPAAAEPVFDPASCSAAGGSSDAPATCPTEAAIVDLVLGEDPAATIAALLEALRQGTPPHQLAAAVAYAGLVRIARFHTSNEHGDWDRALHSFTFANAVHQGLRRAPSAELARGIFDAAMTIYLDRFLNVPPARLPEPPADPAAEPPPAALLDDLRACFDRQQQVDQAGALAARFLYAGGDPDTLIRTLGGLLVREDRDFHTIQSLEAAVRQYRHRQGSPAAPLCLVAAARYLAAHAPTLRAQNQRHRMAWRLYKGDALYEADPADAPATTE